MHCNEEFVSYMHIYCFNYIIAVMGAVPLSWEGGEAVSLG
jgi:hypothetical protein